MLNNKIDKKRSIGTAAKEIGVQEYVIRFWETQFPDFIKPTLGAGGRRYYYDEDIKVLLLIKDYLHIKGYTIKGLQNLLENSPEKIVSKEIKEPIIDKVADYKVVDYDDSKLNSTFKPEIEQIKNISEKNDPTNENKIVKKIKNELLDFQEKLLEFGIKLENA